MIQNWKTNCTFDPPYTCQLFKSSVICSLLPEFVASSSALGSLELFVPNIFIGGCVSDPHDVDESYLETKLCLCYLSSLPISCAPCSQKLIVLLFARTRLMSQT